MSLTRVVNLNTEPCSLRIDRKTKWGNPFPMRRGHESDRPIVIAKFLKWIFTQPQLLAALPELDGHSIGCHCKPKACHGDVLKTLVIAQDSVRTMRGANVPWPVIAKDVVLTVDQCRLLIGMPVIESSTQAQLPWNKKQMCLFE